MTAAVGEGYAAVSADAGLPSLDPRDWALLSPGNVNLYNLQNLAPVSLNDAAIIGKDVVNNDQLHQYWTSVANIICCCGSCTGTWTGAKSSDNSSLSFGVNPDTVLTGDPGLVGTSCNGNTTCTAKPFTLSADWIRLFVLKDANSTLTDLTHAKFERIFHASVQ